MVTSSAVVGSSAIRSFGSQDSAMAIATRCRMPPESWCGYCVSRCSGAGMPTAASSSPLRAFAAWPSSSRCSCSVSINCVPMVSTGLSEVIGSWNTTASERPRNLRRRSGSSRTRSCPSNITRPLSFAFFGSNCRMARDSMVLPQPDSPTTPRVRPAPMARSTRSTARRLPRGVGRSTETSSTESKADWFTARPAADR